MVKLDSVEKSSTLFSELYETYTTPMELEWAHRTNPLASFNLFVPSCVIPLHYYSRKALHHKSSVRRRKLQPSECLTISSENRKGTEFHADRFTTKGEFVVSPEFKVSKATKNNVRLLLLSPFLLMELILLIDKRVALCSAGNGLRRRRSPPPGWNFLFPARSRLRRCGLR